LHTNEGRFIICGEQNDKAYLALYNAQGIFITDTDDIHPDASVCYDIVLTKNDVYTLAGSRGALNQGQYEDDIYVGQAQIIGNNIEIIKEYLPNKQYGSQRAKVINRKSNGELLIGGHNELSPGEWYAHFLEMNDTLGYLDEENIGFGSNLEVYPEDMIPVSGNGHLVVGYLRDNDNQVAALEMMAFRVNGNGDIQGGTMPNLYSHEGLNSIGFAAAPATEAGKYILTGYRKISANREEGYLVKIDENGNIDWEESYGNINTRLLATVAYTGNCGSGYISVGYSGETGNRRIFAIKTNAEGIVE